MNILTVDLRTRKTTMYHTRSTITFGLKYFNFIDSTTNEYVELRIKQIVSITIQN